MTFESTFEEWQNFRQTHFLILVSKNPNLEVSLITNNSMANKTYIGKDDLIYQNEKFEESAVYFALSPKHYF